MSFGTSSAQTTRPVVMGRRAAVVAGHHLAAQAALDALRAGGNAIDAAIAGAAALAVLKPDACGLGSDLFLLYHDAGTGEVHALNASGPAPMRATPEAFANGGIPQYGLRASSVPGAVDGWAQAVTRFGRRTLAQALEPAIALARDGFAVSHVFATSFERYRAAIEPFPVTWATFAIDGRPPRPGELLVQPDAAATLEAIARDGPQAYYRGAFADALDRESRASGGLLRREDLAAYDAEWREPVSVAYRGLEIVGQPPVSVGLVVLEAMKILEHFPMATIPDCSADFIHLHLEAMKLAEADRRAYLGDPHFVSQAPVEALLEGAYTKERARAIDPERALDPEPGAIAVEAGTDTSYLGVIDADGNAVSLLQSVFHVFGSGAVVPGTGVVMNNRMTGFSLDPGSPNVVAPGKRTMHTLNPVLLRRDGQAHMVLGTPGGPSQVYTNSILLLRLVEQGDDVQRALDAPRWFRTPAGEIMIESSVPASVRDELLARGHRVVVHPPHTVAMGGAGIVRRLSNGVRQAGADPRRESYAVAY